MSSALMNARRCMSGAALRARPRAAIQRNALLRRNKIVAFKETDRTVTDWRVKQMVGVAKQYYKSVLSKGDMEIADEILVKHVVYNDMVLSPGKPIVGLQVVKNRIAETRTMYPDLWYDVQQLGFCDSNHIFVQWTAEATNLGSNHGHPATHHHSTWYGVDMLGFSEDRTQISEITVYRSLTAEEKQELEGISKTNSVVSFEDRYELRLNRLHWGQQELRMPE